MNEPYIVIGRSAGRPHRWRVLAPSAAAAALLVSSSHREFLEILSVIPEQPEPTE